MSTAPFSIAPDLETLLSKNNLSAERATAVMQAIIEGRVSPASVAAFAIALRAKGETVEELAALASVMRKSAVAIQAPENALDTCGTGGDKSATFNISTATAFVVAGMGIPVAKHGGRSVSSTSGSADVLKELGVNIEATPACIQECIHKAGIGFLFAPAFHPGMKYVAAVRRELGIRTVFNLLGPLANPAGAKLQLLGVFAPELCTVFAEALKLLGSKNAIVVCGTGTGPNNATGYLDEFSTLGISTYAWLKNGCLETGILDAQSLGLLRPAQKALYAENSSESAAIIRDLLAGKKGPPREIVCLNAAAAALVAGLANDWPAALHLAEQSIDTVRAQEALCKLVACSHGTPI